LPVPSPYFPTPLHPRPPPSARQPSHSYLFPPYSHPFPNLFSIVSIPAVRFIHLSLEIPFLSRRR
ncbi:hypothetical protein BC834DRAFT_946745, partial [Gloeopeniophorella convolvens]